MSDQNKTEKEKRLAAALRANLKKRKEQARARSLGLREANEGNDNKKVTGKISKKTQG